MKATSKVGRYAMCLLLLYYRPREVSQDGAAAYSPVRTVAPVGATTSLALYPNPAPGGVATRMDGRPGTGVRVRDALGRLVFSTTADGSGTATLPLPAGVPAGVYIVRTGPQAARLAVE